MNPTLIMFNAGRSRLLYASTSLREAAGLRFASLSGSATATEAILDGLRSCTAESATCDGRLTLIISSGWLSACRTRQNSSGSGSEDEGGTGFE